MAIPPVAASATPQDIVDVVDRELRDIREAIDDAKVDSDITAGALVTATLAIGNNVISHGLGRQPKGWVVVDVRTAATALYRTAWGSESITLNATAVATVTLWVF